MSDLFDRLAQLSPEKRALLARRLAETGTPVTGVPEPIAVIGLGCRFPGGADSPDAFWQLLERGVDAISEVPADRWSVDELFDANPAAAGKVASRWGGFLHGVDRFDPYFFGIAPREAARMDPQQRLWLEVAWEAFEDAGLTMQALAGSATQAQVSERYLAQLEAGGDRGIAQVGGAADLASTVTPGWRPGEAHLTGKPGQGDKDLPHEHGVGDQALEALRKEIADKRQHEDN